MAAELGELITVTPGVRSGKACVTGTRIKCRASNYSQWLTFPAAAKPGGSGGWLSLSIAAIIAALVSGGPLN